MTRRRKSSTTGTSTARAATTTTVEATRGLLSCALTLALILAVDFSLAATPSQPLKPLQPMDVFELEWAADPQGGPGRLADVAVVPVRGGTPKRLTDLSGDLFGQRQLGRLEEIWVPSSLDGKRIQAYGPT